MILLPAPVRACVFDLDGVLTDTAKIHEQAWKETFDPLISAHSAGSPFSDDDYNEYVDGKPRADGVRSFLRSRHIDLDEGSPDDPPSAATIQGIGNAKNDKVLALIESKGVDAYEGSVRFVRAARLAGWPLAVASSSANAVAVLKTVDLLGYFDTVVDGNVARDLGLEGKPAPDIFVTAARRLGVPAREAAVFEDALAGVQAGRDGAFGSVVGVDRLGGGHGEDLRRHGADTVVSDLSDLLE